MTKLVVTALLTFVVIVGLAYATFAQTPDDTVFKPAPFTRCISVPVEKDGKIVGCTNGGYFTQTPALFPQCADTFRLVCPDPVAETKLVVCSDGIPRFVCPDLPDAPSATPAVQPRGKVWTAFHTPWAYPNVPSKEVLTGKAFWATWLGDIALSSLDAEVSHEGLAHGHHGCREAYGNNSRWQLYRANLPENAAVGVVAFIWLKVKGPKYVLPAFLARPAYVHLQATAQWLDRCY